MAALTDAEAAVYDRQIRVWGVETQKRCSARKLCTRTVFVKRQGPGRCVATLITSIQWRRLNGAKVLIVGCNGLAAEV